MNDTMQDLGFSNPDDLGSSEYRAIHDTIADALGDTPADERREMATAMLDEFATLAESHRARLEGVTMDADSYRFSKPEIDTLLAALRHWQEAISNRAKTPHAELVRMAMESGQPLTAEQIDALCEYINFGTRE